MPRSSRVTPGGMVFHVLNRGVGRMKLFRSDADYRAFEEVLEETLDILPMRVCSYCLMPNQVARYVERNALRANLVDRAEEWRWSSLWRREMGTPEQRKWLADWPLAIPSQWLKIVNRPETETELQALRKCVNRGQPFGPESWIERCVVKLGLESTIRPRGRPRNDE